MLYYSSSPRDRKRGRSGGMDKGCDDKNVEARQFFEGKPTPSWRQHA